MGLDATEVSYFRAVTCFGSVSGRGFLKLSSPKKGTVFLFTQFGRALRERGRETHNQKDLEDYRKPQQRAASLVLEGWGVFPWSQHSVTHMQSSHRILSLHAEPCVPLARARVVMHNEWTLSPLL